MATMLNHTSATLLAPLTTLNLPHVYQLYQLQGVSLTYTALAVVASLLLLEQAIYRYKKGSLPGPSWTIPIIGKFQDSRHPTLENYRKAWSLGSLSVTSVFNIFIVMASSNELTRKIMNSPAFAEPWLTSSAKQILMPDNWVFLTGKEHVEYRKILNTLFTRKALSVYLQTQDAITRAHLAKWLEDAKRDPSAQSIMNPVRDLNMATSLRVFCGPHIPETAIKEITRIYWVITRALELVNFPLSIPGTNTYAAIQARKIAMKWLEAAMASSKRAMAEGGEVECLVDAWVKELVEARANGKLDRDFTDREMAMVVFSFLFASQDAMSSGIIFMFQHLVDHPDVMKKVREEQERVRGGDYTRPMTLEMLDEMPYIKACVKESLRAKPPVTLVPYKTRKAFPLASGYTIPANTMIIPSLYPSLQDPEVYPDPEAFVPDRWLDPESTANANPNKYLVFGSGPHRCIGVEYTTMHMACVLGTASVLMDWEHELTPDSFKTQLIATLFPKDGCLLKFKPRAQ